MVAGANGAGKSTLIERLRALPDFQLPSLYINADDLQRRHSLDAREAQKLAEHHRLKAIQNQESLLYETVMSHPSKIAELQYAAAQGFTIAIFYIGTNSPVINAARVALRVKAGLHDVPLDRIFARYARSMALAPSALAYADLAMVVDNSTLLAGQANLAEGELKLRVRQPEAWVSKLQETVAARAEESRLFLVPAKDAGAAGEVLGQLGHRAAAHQGAAQRRGGFGEIRRPGARRRVDDRGRVRLGHRPSATRRQAGLAPRARRLRAAGSPCRVVDRSGPGCNHAPDSGPTPSRPPAPGSRCHPARLGPRDRGGGRSHPSVRDTRHPPGGGGGARGLPRRHARRMTSPGVVEGRLAGSVHDPVVRSAAHLAPISGPPGEFERPYGGRSCPSRSRPSR